MQLPVHRLFISKFAQETYVVGPSLAVTPSRCRSRLVVGFILEDTPGVAASTPVSSGREREREEDWLIHKVTEFRETERVFVR